MRLTCALCGRKAEPAVYIGVYPVGPACARNANLLGAARRGLGALRLPTGARTQKPADPAQLELDITDTNSMEVTSA